MEGQNMRKYPLKMISLIMVLSLVLIGCVLSSAAASDFPSKNINIIVPFRAGGSLDIMVRNLIPYWERELGVTMVVENYEGAFTQVGTTLFYNRPTDGYTLLAATQPFMSTRIIVGDTVYAIDDFDLINFQQFDPYQTLDDLIAAIRANPRRMRAGTIAGGGSHILLELLKEALDLDFRIVTYNSGAEYRTALLGGHVEFIGSSAQGDVALGDQARVLALVGDTHLSAWPDAPLFSEVLPDVDIPVLGSGRLVAVRKEVRQNYPERFQRLLETYEAAFNHPDHIARLTAAGELETSSIKGNAASNEMNLELHNVAYQFRDLLAD
jgi:tripartite-type tricarboxylate transporter receptor subunit TctC